FVQAGAWASQCPGLGHSPSHATFLLLGLPNAVQIWDISALHQAAVQRFCLPTPGPVYHVALLSPTPTQRGGLLYTIGPSTATVASGPVSLSPPAQTATATTATASAASSGVTTSASPSRQHRIVLYDLAEARPRKTIRFADELILTLVANDNHLVVVTAAAAAAAAIDSTASSSDADAALSAGRMGYVFTHDLVRVGSLPYLMACPTASASPSHPSPEPPEAERPVSTPSPPLAAAGVETASTATPSADLAGPLAMTGASPPVSSQGKPRTSGLMAIDLGSRFLLYATQPPAPCSLSRRHAHATSPLGSFVGAEARGPIDLAGGHRHGGPDHAMAAMAPGGIVYGPSGLDHDESASDSSSDSDDAGGHHSRHRHHRRRNRHHRGAPDVPDEDAVAAYGKMAGRVAKDLAGGVKTLGGKGLAAIATYFQPTTPASGTSAVPGQGAAPGASESAGMARGQEVMVAPRSLPEAARGHLLLVDMAAYPSSSSSSSTPSSAVSAAAAESAIVAHWKAHTNAIALVKFAPAGTRFLTASAHGTAFYVWDLLQSLPPMHAHSGGSRGPPAELSAASATTGYNGSPAHVHRPAAIGTPQCVYKLERGYRQVLVESAAWSLDAHWVSVLTAHGTAHFYPVGFMPPPVASAARGSPSVVSAATSSAVSSTASVAPLDGLHGGRPRGSPGSLQHQRDADTAQDRRALQLDVMNGLVEPPRLGVHTLLHRLLRPEVLSVSRNPIGNASVWVCPSACKLRQPDLPALGPSTMQLGGRRAPAPLFFCVEPKPRVPPIPHQHRSHHPHHHGSAATSTMPSSAGSGSGARPRRRSAAPDAGGTDKAGLLADGSLVSDRGAAAEDRADETPPDSRLFLRFHRQRILLFHPKGHLKLVNLDMETHAIWWWEQQR
ncbi:hypothetical protein CAUPRSCDRAFT_11873, partial [Caulochytrium protostelioides]